MSTSLKYTVTHEGEYLSDDLKYIFEKKVCIPYMMDKENLKYLEGLKDAGVEDAQVLIDAINKYGKVTLEYEN